MKTVAERAIDKWSEDSQIRAEFGNVSEYAAFLECADAGGAIVHFAKLIKAYQDDHECKQSEAIDAVVKAHPEVHRLYLQEVNSSGGTKL